MANLTGMAYINLTEKTSGDFSPPKVGIESAAKPATGVGGSRFALRCGQSKNAGKSRGISVLSRVWASEGRPLNNKRRSQRQFGAADKRRYTQIEFQGRPSADVESVELICVHPRLSAANGIFEMRTNIQ